MSLAGVRPRMPARILSAEVFEYRALGRHGHRTAGLLLQHERHVLSAGKLPRE